MEINTQDNGQNDASDRELESFTYLLSHDLRASLRSVDGFSQALQEDYGDDLDSTAREYLQSIRTSAQQMGRSIDNILELSRSLRMEIHPEVVDLSSLANEVAEELKRIRPESEVAFVIADRVEAYGDEKLLKLVLQNLMGSAFKYTIEQDQSRIEFGATVSNGDTSYFVRDNSICIDTKKEFAETGVGLASVQQIIGRLGGRVWAEESPGQGVTFFFTLHSH